jgi:acetamidase/formamidase
MVDFLVAEKGMPREEAYVVPLAADLHVTQAVDATKACTRQCEVHFR